jgi:hypothetical protein
MKDFKARMERGETFRLDLNKRWEVKIVDTLKSGRELTFRVLIGTIPTFFSFISGLPCANENIFFGAVRILERLLSKPSS